MLDQTPSTIRRELTLEEEAALESFVKEMNENVIPEIVRVTYERQKAADRARYIPIGPYCG